MTGVGDPSRILLFGGTFDPPHMAHVTLPPLAAAKLRCDRIIYVPARISPLKTGSPPTDAAHRLEMLRLALRGVPNASISAIELEREGPSFTIDTVKAFKVADTELFLLLGADQALDFHRWRAWEEIVRIAAPVVLLRPPWTRDAFAVRLAETYSQGEAGSWLSRTLDGDLPLIDVSASDVRRRVRAGRSIDGLVPAAVAAYVAAHGLYRQL